MYPLNVFLMVIFCFLVFYKIAKKILPKPKFRAVYSPLKYQDNPS